MGVPDGPRGIDVVASGLIVEGFILALGTSSMDGLFSQWVDWMAPILLCSVCYRGVERGCKSN